MFISYAREDVAFARDLRERLLALGHAPWMDLFDIPPGARWPDEIDRVLREAGAVIGLMSPASLASENVKNEWDWAIANNRRLILLLIESCEIPFHYISRNYLDFTAGDGSAFDQLLQALTAQPAAGGVPPQIGATQLPALQASGFNPRVTQFIAGRDAELEQLRSHLEAARGSEGSLVLLAGEAGIGKTTLGADLCREAAMAGVLVLDGGCYDLTTTPPYGPWVEVFRSYIPAEGLPELPDQLQVGGGMAGIDSQAALFELAGRFLRSAASIQPLLILLEDVHWADPASLDFLRYLSRTLLDCPILLIATYRDDEIARDHPLAQLLPALVREGRVHRLQLQRLDEGAVLAMVRERYRLSAEDESRLVEYLGRLAEGNPFFVHELLYTLEEQRVLSPTVGGWMLGDLRDAGVPSLIQQVIDGRLTRLDSVPRSLLELAAIIGYDAPLDLLSELYEGSTTELDAALQQLIDHRLLEVGAGQRSVRFNHALVRQSIYESISLLRRRALHRRMGELLASRSRPNPSDVANHLYTAQDERALEWLIRAAEQAQSLFAPAAVIVECDRASELAGQLDTDAPLALYRLRGLARESLGDFDGARADHETALGRSSGTWRPIC